MSELAIDARSNGSALVKVERQEGALEQMRATKAQIEKADPAVLAQIIQFAEAVGIAARARAAVDLAREAADTRIRALRRLGELIVQASDEDRREALIQLVPDGRGYGRCDELGSLPRRYFETAVRELLAQEGAVTPYAVIRNGKIASLKSVEKNIYVDFEGGYWVRSGPKKRTYVETIDEARRVLQMRTDPTLIRLSELFGRARIFAQEIEKAADRMNAGQVKELAREAELAQARVAELLHRAYLAGGGVA